MTVSREIRDCAVRLAHDVGKHIERGALNLRDGEAVAPAIADLVVRDLYALAQDQRASARFAELAAGLGQALALAAPIARCRQLLAEIDRLEPRVRAHEPQALHLAARNALQVATLLREFARQVNEDPP